MTTTTTGRGLALAAGVLAASGALTILLQDAIRTHIWQLEHTLIPVLMAVQILTAHLAITALRSYRPLSALGFVVVACVATWGVLYTSVGKQSRVAAETAAVADDINAQRDDLLHRLAANRKMLDEERTSQAAECASGKGKRCDGLAASVRVYEDAVAGTEATLAKVGPAKPVAANADKMAELLALASGKDQATVKHVLLLTEPFTFATIFELAALVSFGFAFGIRRQSFAPPVSDSRQTSFPPIDFQPPQGPRRKSRRLPDNVVPLRHPAIEAIEKAGKPISNRELASLMSVSEGEASKRWQEVSHLLDVGRQGKELRIGIRRKA
jgi:hypothetical protein